MKDRPELRQVLRIIEMEQIFDTLVALKKEGAFHPQQDFDQLELLNTLIGYYESPLWRQDYEADEEGLLPHKLKRGVLSQDGLYDFLTDLS